MHAALGAVLKPWLGGADAKQAAAAMLREGKLEKVHAQLFADGGEAPKGEWGVCPDWLVEPAWERLWSWPLASFRIDGAPVRARVDVMKAKAAAGEGMAVAEAVAAMVRCVFATDAVELVGLDGDEVVLSSRAEAGYGTKARRQRAEARRAVEIAVAEVLMKAEAGAAMTLKEALQAAGVVVTPAAEAVAQTAFAAAGWTDKRVRRDGRRVRVYERGGPTRVKSNGFPLEDISNSVSIHFHPGRSTAPAGPACAAAKSGITVKPPPAPKTYAEALAAYLTDTSVADDLSDPAWATPHPKIINDTEDLKRPTFPHRNRPDETPDLSHLIEWD